MKTVYIYTLNDPVTSAVRYVGKTVNPYRRLMAHLSRCYNNTKKECWIKSLSSRGLSPKMVIIDEVPEFGWEEQEKKWIQKYRDMGNNLVNGTDGGDGGRMTEDIIKKISKWRTGRKLIKHKKYNNNRGRALTEVHRKAISASKLGIKRSEETSRRISASLSKVITQFSKDGVKILDWESILEASSKLNISHGNISSVCHGHRKSAGHFLWRFKGEEGHH